jgi:hypothetical protein
MQSALGGRQDCGLMRKVYAHVTFIVSVASRLEGLSGSTSEL